MGDTRERTLFCAWAAVGAVAALGYLSAARDGGGVPLPFLAAAALVAYLITRLEPDRRPAWGLVSGAGGPLVVAAFVDGSGVDGVLLPLGLVLLVGGIAGRQIHARREG